MLGEIRSYETLAGRKYTQKQSESHRQLFLSEQDYHDFVPLYFLTLIKLYYLGGKKKISI